jgi:hypothetical protein
MWLAAFGDLFPYIAWSVLVIGIGIAGLAFMVGRALLGRGKVLSLPRTSSDRAATAPTTSDPFLYGSNSERRTASRREGNMVEIAIADPAGGEPLRGWVLDRSVGGLRLRLPAAVPVGIVLSVRPHNAPKLVPWTLLEVRGIRQEGKVWEAGCKFLKTPPWSVLMLFG